MKINETMNLWELADAMGTVATIDDAAKMRDALVASGHTDTADILDADWLAIMDQALPMPD